MTQSDEQVIVSTGTQASFKSNSTLKKALKYGFGHAKLFKAGEYPELPDRPDKLGLTLALDLNIFQTVMKFHKAMPEKKIAVLNFISIDHHRGKFPNTNKTLQETICHRSTLCPLTGQPWLKDTKFSKKAPASVYEDYCICSEETLICDFHGDCLDEAYCEDFVTVKAITCDIPYWIEAWPDDYTAEDNFSLYVKRVKHIMHIAAFHKADIFIVGAYGYGAFDIEPQIIANAWNEALKDYRKKFDYTIFAIHFKEHEIGNFKAFNETVE